jgi:hypothetical protein
MRGSAANSGFRVRFSVTYFHLPLPVIVGL